MAETGRSAAAVTADQEFRAGLAVLLNGLERDAGGASYE